MGSACSTPHLDSSEPPLEILVLSDGVSNDHTLVQFLTHNGWLAASSILQRRLPPRHPHKLPPPLTISAQHHLHHKRSSRSDAAGGHSGSVHPAPPQPAASASAASPTATPSISPSTSHSPTSTTTASTCPTTPPPCTQPPPLLYFLCDAHPVSVRFHTCPDYSQLARRRASTLAAKPRGHAPGHSRRPSSTAQAAQPVHSSAPLDGAVVFLSTRDVLVAGSVLIAGIRPMLKRRVKDGGAGGGKGGSGLGGGGGGGGGLGEKGRSVVGRVGAEGNMLPFVVVGVEEEAEGEAKTTPSDSPKHVKAAAATARIAVQPRADPPDNSTTTTKPQPEPSRTPSPVTATDADFSPPHQPSTPTPTAASTTASIPTHKQLHRQRGSMSSSSGERVSGSQLGERPNAGGAAGARRMGLEDGKGLAVDSGAVGYAAVELRTGRAMDVALKQLVLAIRKDRQLRGHH